MFKIIALSTKGRTPEEEAVIALTGQGQLAYYCYDPALNPIEYAEEDPVLKDQTILSYQYTNKPDMPKYIQTYLLVTAEQANYPLIVYNRNQNLFFSEKKCEFGQWCSFGEHTTRFTDMNLILKAIDSIGLGNQLQVFSDLTRPINRCIVQ